ncbi:MAG: rRNA cytosine-C5-methylase [Rikenellaceae bacterium]
MERLPSDFINNINSIFEQTEAEELLKALDSEPVISIRYNPHKMADEPSGERVGWSSEGYYLPQRAVYTLDPLFHGGVYYSQEASSMFLEVVLKKVLSESEEDITALDMCAAPGGKSTLISSMLKERGVLVANEAIKSRAKILKENIIKWGVGNVIVSNSDSDAFSKSANMFDIVVVDTPCSGEGMFRKDKKSRAQWSKENVELCAMRSRRIVANAIESIKDGGVLVYSTCTFNRAENEQLIDWISDNYEIENIQLEIVAHWGITLTSASNIDCYRFLPHKTKGEGFFIAAMRIKKDGEVASRAKKTQRRKDKASGEGEKLSKEQIATASKWLDNQSLPLEIVTRNGAIFAASKEMLQVVTALDKGLNIIYFGVEMGEFFGNKFKPSHTLATSILQNRDLCNSVEVGREDALEFLRKNSLDAAPFKEGINLVCYKNTPLGYIKRIGARTNNLYPKEYRIYNL